MQTRTPGTIPGVFLCRGFGYCCPVREFPVAPVLRLPRPPEGNRPRLILQACLAPASPHPLGLRVV